LSSPASFEQEAESLNGLLVDGRILIDYRAHTALLGDLYATHAIPALDACSALTTTTAATATTTTDASASAYETVHLSGAFFELLQHCSFLLSGGAQEVVTKIQVTVIA
jgi:hypothetical protein